MAWQDIQKKTFTKWSNEHLKSRGRLAVLLRKTDLALGMAIQDLFTDLRDGILLINLLETISEKKVGPYNRNPRIGAQRLENQGIALNFIKVRVAVCYLRVLILNRMRASSSLTLVPKICAAATRSSCSVRLPAALFDIFMLTRFDLDYHSALADQRQDRVRQRQE